MDCPRTPGVSGHSTAIFTSVHRQCDIEGNNKAEALDKSGTTEISIKFLHDVKIKCDNEPTCGDIQ